MDKLFAVPRRWHHSLYQRHVTTLWWSQCPPSSLFMFSKSYTGKTWNNFSSSSCSGPFKCYVTQMGVGGVWFSGKKRYEGVMFNVISISSAFYLHTYTTFYSDAYKNMDIYLANFPDGSLTPLNTYTHTHTHARTHIHTYKKYIPLSS